MLVESDDTGETPMVGYFMSTEGGEALARREKRWRIDVYMGKELIEQADEMVSYVGTRSQDEFATGAMKSYIGFLNFRKAGNYLLQPSSSMLTSTVHDSEDRLAHMDFRLTVEVSKLAHVIAYSHEADEDALERLHLKYVDEVKRTNGAVESEGAYKYQKREIQSARVVRTIYESCVYTTDLILFMVCQERSMIWGEKRP